MAEVLQTANDIHPHIDCLLLRLLQTRFNQAFLVFVELLKLFARSWPPIPHRPFFHLMGLDNRLDWKAVCRQGDF